MISLKHFSLSLSSLLTLATHLVTISEQGTFGVLRLLLNTAFPQATHSGKA